jgi:hypothetical protein
VVQLRKQGLGITEHKVDFLCNSSHFETFPDQVLELVVNFYGIENRPFGHPACQADCRVTGESAKLKHARRLDHHRKMAQKRTFCTTGEHPGVAGTQVCLPLQPF